MTVFFVIIAAVASVQDEIPLSEDDPKEEDQASAPQAFTLPTRKPGETGELNPGLLPDWLRTGEHATDHSGTMI